MAYHIQFTNQLENIFKITDPTIWLNRSFFEDDLLLITQNRQIKNWLIQQATKHFGMSPFRAEQCQLSDQAIRTLLPDMEGIGDRFNFTKQFDENKRQILFLPDLRMVVYKYLESKVAQNDTLFDPIKQYLRSSVDHAHREQFVQSSKLFALASSVSHLLEEYAARYEELMDKWSNNELYREEDVTEKWQQRLWYDLFGQENAQFALPSDVLRDVLKEKRRYLGSIRKVIIIGTPFLTDLTHRFFMHLSQEIRLDIIIYTAIEPNILVQRPTFFDRQYAGALWEYFTDVKDNDWHHTITMHEAARDSILHQIQHGLTYHNMPDAKSLLQDDSIRLIACTDPMREVETLKDYILHALESDKTLKLEDICIVMSDQNLYTPYLNLVFQHNPHGIYLPLHFDDLLADARLPVHYQAVLQLLNLSSSRFKRSEIFNLLRNNEILHRLDFTEQERLIWDEFCQEHHVVWGFDTEHKQSEISGASEYFTWVQAFESYLEEAMYGNDSEYDLLRTIHTSMIGKLIYFVHRLYENFYDLPQRRYTLEGWITYLEPKLARFIAGEEALSGRINLFRSLNEISASLDNLQYFKKVDGDNEIPFVIILQLIKESMDREVERALQKNNRRGILCAPIAALRCIPFRIVAFLGMDENKYPKKEQKSNIGYNLGEQFAQTFIMSQSNNERASFLEMFLAINDKVWFFYQSIHRQTGHPIEPSSVLYDLFKEAHISLVGNNLDNTFVVKVPLYPFHYSLLQDRFPFTYHPRAKEYAQEYYQSQEITDKDCLIFPASKNQNQPRIITLDSLVAFICDPFFSAISHHLGKIDKEDEVDDVENYSLLKKQQKELLIKVVQHALSNPYDETYIDQLWKDEVASGKIIETPYIVRHHQQYKYLAQLLNEGIYAQSHHKELSLESNNHIRYYQFCLNNLPVTIDATVKSVYSVSSDPNHMVDYVINDYIQKADDAPLGYSLKVHVKEKLLNSLWQCFGYKEHLSCYVGEFNKNKDNEELLTFQLHSMEEENHLLSESEIEQLLLFYETNLERPLCLTTKMWVQIRKDNLPKKSTGQTSKEKEATIVDSYQKIFKKLLTNEFKPYEQLLSQFEFFALDKDKIVNRELFDHEKNMLEFLWNKFFSE